MSSLRWPPAPLPSPDQDGYQAAPAEPGTGPDGAAAPPSRGASPLPTRTARGAHRPTHQRPASDSGPTTGPVTGPQAGYPPTATRHGGRPDGQQRLPSPPASSADPL